MLVNLNVNTVEFVYNGTAKENTTLIAKHQLGGWHPNGNARPITTIMSLSITVQLQCTFIEDNWMIKVTGNVMTPDVIHHVLLLGGRDGQNGLV